MGHNYQILTRILSQRLLIQDTDLSRTGCSTTWQGTEKRSEQRRGTSPCIFFNASRAVRARLRYHATINLNTHTYTDPIMSMKTISLTEEAFRKLKALKKDETMSFSDIIIKYYPVRRKLTDVLAEIGDCTDLAGSVERVSRDMRKTQTSPQSPISE